MSGCHLWNTPQQGEGQARLIESLRDPQALGQAPRDVSSGKPLIQSFKAGQAKPQLVSD